MAENQDTDEFVIPEGGRFSFRLSSEEVERVRQVMQHVRKRYPKNTRMTQKLLFLEGLDAIEHRANENIRKSGGKKKRAGDS